MSKSLSAAVSLAAVCLLFLLPPVSGHDETKSCKHADHAAVPPPRKPLTPAQRRALLDSRKAPGHSIEGTFDSFCSMLFAFNDVCIHTHSQQVNQTRLQGIFAESYKPTYDELFDTIARQTGSTMHYDPKTDYWTFDPPAMPMAYSIQLAPNWTAKSRGMETNYVPTIAPCGMDVYTLGKYSADSPEKAKQLYEQVREKMALVFASEFDQAVKAADMPKVTVGGAEALYYEVQTPRTGAIWRQWSFVIDGQAFLIVSSIDKKNEATLLPQVQSMVASFHAQIHPH